MFKLLLQRKKQTKRVPCGSCFADAIFSTQAPTGDYVIHKCEKLHREFAEENTVVETKLLPFHRFCVSVNGAIAFKGDFDFVEHCREVSPTAFIEAVRQHVRVAL